jgi:four helix bundle protein
MVQSNHEKLEVYQLAEQLSDQVWSVVEPWHYFPKDTIGKQLVRAVDSIGANIAEGVGRGSYADNRRFVYIARGSLYETKYWLRRAHERGLLLDEDLKHITPVLRELAPRLNAYLNTLKNGTN